MARIKIHFMGSSQMLIQIWLIVCLSAGSNKISYARTYTTKFPLTEHPISESGNWINGKTAGIDWSDVSTTPGLAIGHQPGNAQYTDATALLTGKWTANQSAEASVFVGTTYTGDYPEVELRLRSTISAHKNTGYEIAFSACGHVLNAYLIIVRWNGPVRDFTYLTQLKGQQYGVVNGDVVRATIIGNTISAYINGVLVGQASDGTYLNGSPGMGFNFDCFPEKNCKGDNNGYGFTKYTASDEDSGKIQNTSLIETLVSYLLSILSFLS
jgi:hypothetical protein